MNKTQGWVLIGFVAVALAVWGLNSYNNSVQGKVNTNVRNSNEEGLTQNEAEFSCGQMCAETFNDPTDNQTCVLDCAKALGLPPSAAY